ncbi:RMD1 family protein [Phanerochaete sordida]|uniref:RMD1 family protein n=1 Tax=Phanerochaete sordida TaxID=48140 RepID=A0A9P3LC94_9APHY|nr:RMD1 family protein [Phanerochaete sordida]
MNILRGSFRPLRSFTPRSATASCRVASLPRTTIARRTFATNSEEKPPKPKASTPLRRTASASLPIRSNPTPTRSSIQPVFTLTTAERYALGRLPAYLPAGARSLHDAWWVPRWGADGAEGEVFVFGNGSIVCWGLGEAEAERFARDVVSRAKAEIAPLREPETEDLEFVMDPSEKTRLQGDLIILGQTPPPESEETLPTELPPSVLPQETLLARYAYSQALARSTALSALEVSLENYLSSMAQLPDSLVRLGRPGLGRVALVKKLGELLKFRQGLNLNRENFYDTPDLYWAEPVLEGYFNALSNALEMKARIMSVNDKITYAAEMQSVLRSLLTETSGHRMELIIIALIAVEVVICLIRDGPELWHMVIDDADSEPQTHEKRRVH